MSVRRFELVEGSSSKFWEVQFEGASYTVRYGRIGTSGQAKSRTLSSENAAKAEAEKLVSEKVKKGYVEVTGRPPTAPTTPTATTAPTATRPAGATDKKPAQPRAKAKSRGPAIPPLEVDGKSIGSRALANAAERFAATSTREEWNDAERKVATRDSTATAVLAHLLEHGAFVPVTPLHAMRIVKAVFDLATRPEVAVRVLSALPVFEKPTDERQVAREYVPVLVRLQVRGPEALAAAQLPPALARLALLQRVLAGATLPREQALPALEGLGELLPFGGLATVRIANEQNAIVAASANQVIEAFARNLGPDWLTQMTPIDHVPAEVAGPALEGQPLEEVARWLSMFNAAMLDARDEPAARFFEVAAAHEGQKARYLRSAGIRRASSPDEIPGGIEDLFRPVEVHRDGPGFARLGAERLDAWATRWLDRHPDALDIHEPRTSEEHEAAQIGIGLKRLPLEGLPFGEAMMRRLVGLPRVLEVAPDRTDHRRFLSEIKCMTPAGATHVLPLLARMVAEHEDDEKTAMPLRLLACAAIRRWPADETPDERYDALVSLGDGVDHETKGLVVDTVKRLPPQRGEQIVARTASTLREPLDELSFAAAGASEAAMRRFARLLVTARYDGLSYERTRGLRALGPAFGPMLADALASEPIDEAFLADLERILDPAAFAHVRDTAGARALDLPGEMTRIAAEVGGERAVVYAMSPGAPGTGVSRVGGRAAGFAPEEIPRHRGRKLLHAFTVDLHETPELAQRYPGARALCVWIQAYTEGLDRGQALIPRTEEQLAAHPVSEPAPSLSLTRLEVPVAAWGDEVVDDLAKHARRLLYRGAGFLLGGPIWLQDGPHGVDPEFVAQYDERLAPGANFGDYGICYSFASRCEWQCH